MVGPGAEEAPFLWSGHRCDLAHAPPEILGFETFWGEFWGILGHREWESSHAKLKVLITIRYVQCRVYQEGSLRSPINHSRGTPGTELQRLSVRRQLAVLHVGNVHCTRTTCRYFSEQRGKKWSGHSLTCLTGCAAPEGRQHSLSPHLQICYVSGSKPT